MNTNLTLEDVTAQLLVDVTTEAERVSRQLGKIAREIESAQQRMTKGQLPSYTLDDDLLGREAGELAARMGRLRYITQLAGAVSSSADVEAAYAAGLARDSYR